jgi:hypothetical protein
MGRLQNNPSIGWVHPKSTHTHPLAWGNKKVWKVYRFICQIVGIYMRENPFLGSLRLFVEFCDIKNLMIFGKKRKS